jgi:hypothetical protein
MERGDLRCPSTAKEHGKLAEKRGLGWGFAELGWEDADGASIESSD